LRALVVIYNLDILRVPVNPAKHDSPLVVDANGMLALAVAFEAFQPVSSGYPKIVEAHGGFQKLELAARLPFDGTESAHRFIVEQALGVLAGKVSYHPCSMGRCNYSVKRNTRRGISVFGCGDLCSDEMWR